MNHLLLSDCIDFAYHQQGSGGGSAYVDASSRSNTVSKENRSIDVSMYRCIDVSMYSDLFLKLVYIMVRFAYRVALAVAVLT